MKYSEESLKLTKFISDNIDNKTFHHHYYVLFDIAKEFEGEINYLEIGCYAGGSACLILQREKTNVYSIDLGYPIKPQVVYNNVNKLNKHNNYFECIQGNSNSNIVLSKVNKLKKEGIDILFIDGDHSYKGVISDFNLYSPFVKVGGYIVFDDYNDKQHSPEVKPAVDDIVKNLYGYDFIGTVENIYGARPSELKEGNCFVIKRIK